MGGAETAARQLAEHLRAHTDWEAEVHTTCALDPHTWADELEPGTTEVNGVPVHRHPSAHGRLPDFYGLDGLLRLAPRLATRGAGERVGRLQRPGLARSWSRRSCASDADVVAFYPYLYHPTVATIGKVPVPAVLHPAAHDEPALYLPGVPRHLRRRRRLLLPHRGGAHARRADVPGGRPSPDRARARRGRVRGHGPARRRAPRPRRPALHRERRAGRRAQGLEDAGLVLRHLQGAPSRAAGPGAGRPGLRPSCRRTPTSS